MRKATDAEVEQLASNWIEGVYAHPEPPCLAVTEDSLREDLLVLLSEAAVEISNLDGPRNVVAQRLRHMLLRIERGAIEPLNVVIAGAE